MISAIHLSKWYGETLGIQDVSVEIGPGITALVGPNGSGKSTFFRLLIGALLPSQGTIRLLEENPVKNRGVLSNVGFSPEGSAVPENLAAFEWVTDLARIAGMGGTEAGRRAEAALRTSLLPEEAWHRPMKGFSNGMKQKAKLAQAIAHEPNVLILDEPFAGVDPLSRIDLMKTLRSWAAGGRCVVFSSHNLAEVERLTETVHLLHRGRLLAGGKLRDIRRWLDRYPYRLRIDCDDPRRLAGYLSRRPEVVGIEFPDGATLIVRTHQLAPILRGLPSDLVASGVRTRGFYPEDEGLEAIFRYLMEGHAK